MIHNSTWVHFWELVLIADYKMNRYRYLDAQVNGANSTFEDEKDESNFRIHLLHIISWCNINLSLILIVTWSFGKYAFKELNM